MKRVLSLALVAAMLVSLTTSLAGCGLFAKKLDSGTEAARLLLANERLDPDHVAKDINVGLSAPLSKATTYHRTSEKRLGIRGESFLTEGHTYQASDFDPFSSSMVEFDQFLGGIEREATAAAAAISHMKDEVGVTDKWVAVGGEMHMLRVYETKDVLLVLTAEQNIHVYYRYTDETAKNVYEMYSFYSYDDGTTGRIRTVLIPGERYEYMYCNSNGFEDYFIAENTRGYWVNTRFGYFYDEAIGRGHVNFSPYIIKDGLGYGAQLTMDSAGTRKEWYTVFDPLNNRELFRVRDDSNTYRLDLYFTAIADGLVSVSTPTAYVEGEERVYATNSLDTIVTGKGTYTTPSSDINAFPKNTFAPESGYVQYLYGEGTYYGSMTFAMVEPQMSLDGAFVAFGEYAAEIGLSLSCDMETAATSVAHAKSFAENFGESFSFFGHKVTSLESAERGRDVLLSKYDEAYAAYDEVKDFAVATEKQKLSRRAHFAPLAVTAGSNSFRGGQISLAGISATASDLALFEEGEEYVLKVALSLIDVEGNPIGVNTVPLSGGEEIATVFSGKAITLTATGHYAVPQGLDRGTYAAVVYMATREDGIRVSELVPIAFVTVEEGRIASSLMQIDAVAHGENLHLVYEIANVRHLSLPATAAGYTYEELSRAMILEILAYGAPARGAVPEHEDGTPLAEGEPITAGRYRILCYLGTASGMAQSYLYVTVE
ncbi:MAG: hypothetical protein J6T24_06845 [Clostridia bacterium]|nr:hypothetical protein [Clostridia bacterium]